MPSATRSTSRSTPSKPTYAASSPSSAWCPRPKTTAGSRGTQPSGPVIALVASVGQGPSSPARRTGAPGAHHRRLSPRSPRGRLPRGVPREWMGTRPGPYDRRSPPTSKTSYEWLNVALAPTSGRELVGRSTSEIQTMRASGSGPPAPARRPTATLASTSDTRTSSRTQRWSRYSAPRYWSLDPFWSPRAAHLPLQRPLRGGPRTPAGVGDAGRPHRHGYSTSAPRPAPVSSPCPTGGRRPALTPARRARARVQRRLVLRSGGAQQGCR